MVVALEETKSIRVPGWLLERESVAGGIRYGCPESVFGGFARRIIAGVPGTLAKRVGIRGRGEVQGWAVAIEVLGLAVKVASG